MDTTKNQFMGEHVERLLQAAENWFLQLEHQPGFDEGYRKRLVIPREIYKGFGWGVGWALGQMLGFDHPRVKPIWKKCHALLRLSRMQGHE